MLFFPFVVGKNTSIHLKANRSLLIRSGVGESVRSLPFPNSTRIYKLRGNETGGRFTMMEGRIHIGEGPQLHIHRREDETFYVIRGELQFIIGDETFCAPAGTIVHAPREIKMSFRNVNSPDAYLQLIFTPAGIEHYFAEVSQVYEKEPINHKLADQIAKKYGMDMLGMPKWKDIGCSKPSKKPSR